MKSPGYFSGAIGKIKDAVPEVGATSLPWFALKYFAIFTGFVSTAAAIFLYGSITHDEYASVKHTEDLIESNIPKETMLYANYLDAKEAVKAKILPRLRLGALKEYHGKLMDVLHNS